MKINKEQEVVMEIHKKKDSKVHKNISRLLLRIIYPDYEGMSTAPSNYYDIMCVYMV